MEGWRDGGMGDDGGLGMGIWLREKRKKRKKSGNENKNKNYFEKRLMMILVAMMLTIKTDNVIHIEELHACMHNKMKI